MEIRLLGPMEIWRHGREVDAGPPQQRAVLAALALEVGRVVPTDRLIALLWPEGPPGAARSALHALLSRLRRSLSNGDRKHPEVRLLTRPPGYLLRADPQCIDAHRFRTLVAGARTEPDDGLAAEKYRRALALWRGPAFADLHPALRARLGGTLEVARWSALEDRIGLDLRSWRHLELVDELAELVDRHPERERMAAAYMTALTLSGRPAEALEVFDRCRRKLRDELGADPGPDLRRLHVAVLRGGSLAQRPATLPDRAPGGNAKDPPSPTS